MVKSLKAELMKIEVESEIFSKIPDYRIGVAIILGIVNSGEINRKPEISTEAPEQIAVWDEAAKKLGIKTSDFPQANKSLAKRHAKSRSEINRKPEISTEAPEQIAVWDEAAKKLGIKTSDFPQANKSLAKRHAKS